MTAPPESSAKRTIGGWLLSAARLRPGVTIEAADAELQAISSQLASEFPETNRGTEYYGVSLRTSLVGDARRPLLLMMGAVTVLLLIAFVNVSNLLFVRSMTRRGEFALRVALGASRRRLFGQFLTENLLLALAAGAAGVMLAHWGTAALVALVPQSVQVPALADVGVNATVLTFAVLVAMSALTASLSSSSG